MNRDVDTNQYGLTFRCMASYVRLDDLDMLSALTHRRLIFHAVRLIT